MHKFLFYLAVVAAATTPSGGQSIGDAAVNRVEGKVVSVEEGDRIKFATADGTAYTLFLIGVDAPDQKQENFKKSRGRLKELAEGKEAVALLYRTNSGDFVAMLFVGRLDVGLRLIQDGLAWYYPGHFTILTAGERRTYTDAEASARTARAGIWKDDNPEAPWTLRGEKLDVAPMVVEAKVTHTSNKHDERRSETSMPGRKYILGPRGGCYYLNDKGHKVYVKDKSLCAQE